MGKTHKVAEVKITVYDDLDGHPSVVQVTEWRRGSRYRLVAIDDLGPFPMAATRLAELQAYVAGSVEWCVGDAIALDSGRML